MKRRGKRYIIMTEKQTQRMHGREISSEKLLPLFKNLFNTRLHWSNHNTVILNVRKNLKEKRRHREKDFAGKGRKMVKEMNLLQMSLKVKIQRSKDLISSEEHDYGKKN